MSADVVITVRLLNPLGRPLAAYEKEKLHRVLSINGERVLDDWALEDRARAGDPEALVMKAVRGR